MRDLAILISLFALVPASRAQDRYELVLDGRESSIDICSLAGNPKAIAAGDLFWVGGVLLRLPPPTRLVLRDELKNQGCILRERDGAWSMAAVDTRRLLYLSASERAELLGVRVNTWNDAVAAALRDLDPEIPLTLTDRATIPSVRVLQLLPERVRHVVLHWERDLDLEDHRPANTWEHLRSLHLFRTFGEPASFDLQMFAGAEDLRFFDASNVRLSGLDHVASWSKLRSFSVVEVPLGDLNFLTESRALRNLSLDTTGVGELDPLSTLPELHTITCQNEELTHLPREGFSSLASVLLWNVVISSSELEAFQEHFSRCEMHLPVNRRALEATLARADRLVVHTEHHPEGESETRKQLFESTDRETIARIAGLLRVETSALHMGEARGDANPTLRFFAGAELVAELSSIDGDALRSSVGPWIGDADMPAEAKLPFARWLARIGASQPLISLQVDLARETAAALRADRRAAIVGIDRGTETEKIFEQRVLDLVESAADGDLIALRLLGCHEGAWNQLQDVDNQLLRWLLAHFDSRRWMHWEALAAADPRAAIGLAMFLFEGLALFYAEVPSDSSLLAFAACAALTHPQSWNRARCVAALRQARGELSLQVLRDAVAGRFEPRDVAPEELDRPKLKMREFANDEMHPSYYENDVPVLAAMALAARGDVASKDAIAALAARSNGEARELVEQALLELKALK